MHILGFLIGGLIGGFAFYFLKASKKEKEQFFKKIGHLMSELGEEIETGSLSDKQAAFEEIIKKVPKKGNLANAAALAAIGINLWNKWR